MGDKGGAGSLQLFASSTESSHQRASRFVKGTSIEKPPNQDGKGLLAMFVHPLCILLLCVPLGIASEYLHWGDICTFWLNFVGMIPLAKILGDATEELAAGLKNDMLAGLLNATFGNAVEVVIMVQTLRAGLIDVVKATLLGSVLSNLLLVLGCSFFFGGIVSNAKKWKEGDPNRNGANYRSSELQGAYTEFVGEKVQTFSVLSAMVNTSMLLLSCLSLSLVTVFYSETHVEGEMDEILIPVSRTCSIIIILAYCAYIFFQLVTHRLAMAGPEENGDEEDQDAMLSIPTAVTVMFCCTIVVAWTSDLLVSSLEPVVEQMHISTHFIGIVLLPIVGNACEHASAIRFAIMDKPGLSIGIAVGSSTQISLFVVPMAVIIGWAIGQPMDLNFGSLNTTVMCISVVVVLSVVVDGAANWLQGYLLVSAYFVIAVLYWHLPDKLSEIS
jgi:Ca2+:H+ antiporter|mmetsp:Transcript_113833/g.179152  ORF Transcript_113833/g.179152 Transcript_113833/m.179152 type:complete len:443 (+) Transcript_113833:68-1396(+)